MEENDEFDYLHGKSIKKLSPLHFWIAAYGALHNLKKTLKYFDRFCQYFTKIFYFQN